MGPVRYICLPLLAVALSGCLAKAALDVATAPVKVAGKAVDMATTSQSEADEKRGRELRKQEERLGKLEREWRKLDKACGEGNTTACTKRDEIALEIDSLSHTLPAQPER
ncbi:hypothetical protein [Altererythrobacter fulvus]|uniref:hypothetical protein n=1 Tax=Caenibius fulvus TaxID=2126012 RepID=UPI003017A34D